MKPEDFDLFSTLVKQRSGLVLTREKAYLLESRLLPVSRKYNLKSLEEMAIAIRAHRDEQMMTAVTEAMMTCETSFFRDNKPFDQFQNILLPQFLASRASKKLIRIWSAAGSSGQEAYSLAMICAEEADKLKDWKVEIIGTDISKEMTERAKLATYSHFEVQRGLPARKLVKHFTQIGGDKWQIKENVRQMVQFQDSNLLHAFGTLGGFDIVYCRNVLGYFDQPTKTRVLDAISNVMAPDGNLVLGRNETVVGFGDKFKAATLDTDLYALTASTPVARVDKVEVVM